MIPKSSRITVMKRSISLLIALALLGCGCAAARVPAASMPESASPSVTGTAAPSAIATLTPTWTPVPASATPTPVLIQGKLAIKVNVRSGPGTSFAALGLLNAGENVQILYRDAAGSWYQILYPPDASGTGWVAAQYVQVAEGTRVPLQATPTPAGPSGKVTQRLNVRAGPGLTFDSLGTLAPDTIVRLTGKNSSAAWLQIEYPGAPGGRGWVTAQYVQTEATGLPVLDDYGRPAANGTQGPTPVAVTPTPTVGPAFADHDSEADPAIRVTFSFSGTRQFTYSSQVSAPSGDPEDWVEFTPFAVNGAPAHLVFSLACSGNGSLSVEIWQAGGLVSGWGSLGCGEADKQVALPSGMAYQVHLLPAAGQGLRLVDYVLTVENLP
jgi:uncharacterized protein YraI